LKSRNRRKILEAEVEATEVQRAEDLVRRTIIAQGEDLHELHMAEVAGSAVTASVSTVGLAVEIMEAQSAVGMTTDQCVPRPLVAIAGVMNTGVVTMMTTRGNETEAVQDLHLAVAVTGIVVEAQEPGKLMKMPICPCLAEPQGMFRTCS
jgi:hypothetical protein